MYVYQRWESGTRYYEARVRKNLWEELVVTRIWGGIGTGLGRESDTICTGLVDVERELAAIAKLREKRGYSLVAQT